MSGVGPLASPGRQSAGINGALWLHYWAWQRGAVVAVLEVRWLLSCMYGIPLAAHTLLFAFQSHRSPMPRPADAHSYMWQRGLSLYYLGRYAEGAEQFRVDVAVNPNDTWVESWMRSCAEARL